MMRQRSLLLTFFLVSFGAATASAQIAEADKALVTLRDSDRAPLTQLVNDFLRHQQSQQWDLLYDLFSPAYVRSVTRTEYAETRQTLTAKGRTMFMLDFDLKRVLVNNPFDGQYSFAGCANVFKDGQIQFTNAHVDVVVEKDVWRIADYGMFATCQPPDLVCKQ